MKKNKVKKIKKNLVIDADNIPYVVAPQPTAKKDSLEGDVVKVGKIKLPVLIKAYEDYVDELTKEAKKEFKIRGWKLKEVIVIVSDPDTNFRYKLYPEYKGNRASREKTKEFYKIRKWAYENKTFYPNTEADDVVAHYVRNGAVGVTIDKDLLKGVAGTWFNCHHMHKSWCDTTVEEANKFNYLQTLAGDLTDNIKGINRVALTTAEKLLDGDYSWDKVVEVYESKGMTETDAILTRRLIGMDQWTPETGVVLWNPPKLKRISDGTTGAPEKSSKTDQKKIKETKTVSVSRGTTVGKDIIISQSTDELQEPVSDNPIISDTGHFKCIKPPYNVIRQAVYNQLSPSIKKLFVPTEA